MQRRRRITWSVALGVPFLVIAALFVASTWLLSGMFDVGPPHEISEQEARDALARRSIHIPRTFSLDSMTVSPVFAGAPSYRGSFSAPADRFEDYKQIVARAPGMVDRGPANCWPGAQFACSPNIVDLVYPEGATGFDTTTIRVFRGPDRATMSVHAQGH